MLTVGTQADVYMRNLQLWNSPFSLELAKLRAFRSPDPNRFRNTLVAHFRFDESGGSVLYNSAPIARRADKKVIRDVNRVNFEWVHYIEL
jgi:hypothetical protein